MKKFSSFLFLITLFSSPKNSFGWGAIGHTLIAEEAMRIIDQNVLKKCGITSDEIIVHTNDPDKIWRTQRLLHHDEARAHFFHLDKQPSNWAKRSSALDKKQGYLFYRIIEWSQKAKSKKDNKDLFYGLSHYLGDLTQPLHLHHDYDGKENLLPGIHSQFETKMVAKYQKELKYNIQKLTKNFPERKIWSDIDYQTLISNIAKSNFEKAATLFSSARQSQQFVGSKKSKLKFSKHGMRFIKKDLWLATGSLASEQMALAAKLIAFTFEKACQ